MTILQLNKGNSDLFSRVPHINEILTKYKPQLLILNELNLHCRDTVTPKLFPQYKLVVDNLRELDGVGRTGILVHNTLNYKRRTELETKGTSTIWLEISIKGQKAILIQALYRQFQRQNTPNTLSMNHQKTRWNHNIEKWEMAIEEGLEIITMGDHNLDKKSWDKNPQDMNPYENAKNPMVTQLKEKILSKGMFVVNDQPTWNLENPSTEPSTLDLILANRKDKILNHETIFPTFSDHAMLLLRRKSPNFQPKTSYMYNRNYKNYDRTNYNDNLMNHYLFIETLYEQDPSIVAQNIQQIVQQSMDPLAPMKRTQVPKSTNSNISTEAKLLLAQRDTAYQNFKRTGDSQYLRQYKYLRNQATTQISKDKYLEKVQIYHGDRLATPKQKWKQIKKDLGQDKYSSPTLIREGQFQYTKAIDMAQALNRLYITSIRNIRNKMETSATNPMISYNKFLRRNDPELSFSFKTITMKDLSTTLTKMRATGSSSVDNISMWMLKQGADHLRPLLLHMVNRIILTGIYPSSLKTTKIVPVRKPEKDETTNEGWRPINIVCSLLKVAEKVLLAQIIKYLEDKNLISHIHHGAVKTKSTQTEAAELYDKLLENLNEDTYQQNSSPRF